MNSVFHKLFVEKKNSPKMKFTAVLLLACLSAGYVSSLTTTTWGDVNTVKVLSSIEVFAEASDEWQQRNVVFPNVSFESS